MNRLELCLNADDIHAYLLGLVGDERATAIEQHLKTCRSCVEAVAAHSAGDSFTHALRAGSSGPGPAEPEAVRALIDQLHREGPPADTVAPTSADSVVGGDSLPADDLPLLASPLLPDEIGRLGGYRVLRRLGAGGMGIVLLAEDPKLNRKVALKVLRRSLAAQPEHRQRFQREAQAAAKLSHDHIVTVYQVGEEGDTPYFAMQLLEGESLEDRLQALAGTGRTMAMEEVVRIGKQTAEGLAAAHEQGLIHRDIKPANVWLEGQRGRVKLLDFGLARDAEGDARLTQSGTILGTPHYMAPEQIESGVVDHRCDLFSLGCLYQMATGKLPFVAPTVFATLRAVTASEPTPAERENPGIPAALAGLIASLLAKDPANRPVSARAVMMELEQLERTSRPTDRQEEHTQALPLEQPKPVKRRWSGLVAAAGLLLTVGLAAGIVLTLRTPDGTLILETDDPTAKFVVTGTSVEILQGQNRYELKLKPGKFSVECTNGKGHLKLDATEFVMTSGENKTVRATLDKPIPPPPGETGKPLHPAAFVRNPARLPGAEGWEILPAAPSGGAYRFSPDSRYLAGRDGSAIRIWDVDTKQLVKVLLSSNLSGQGLAWSPDGTKLGVPNDDGRFEIWDMTAGRRLNKPRPIKTGRRWTAMAWAPNGEKLAIGFCGIVEIVDAITGELLDKLLHDGNIYSLAWSPAGKLLASVSEGGTVKIWETNSGKEMPGLDELFKLEGAIVAAEIAWSPDGHFLVGVTCHGGPPATMHLNFWDTQTWKNRPKVTPIDPRFSRTTAFALLPDSQTIACSGRFWNATSGKMLREIHSERHRRILPVEEQFPDGLEYAWSPDAKRALTSGRSGKDGQWDTAQLYIWDTDAGKRTKLTSTNGSSYRSEQVFSPDGKWAAVNDWEAVRVLETATGKQVSSWAGARSGTWIAFSPKGDRILSCYPTCGISVWPSGARADAPQPYDGAHWYYAAWSPDGRKIGALHNPGHGLPSGIHIHSLETKKSILLEGTEDWGNRIILWAPDGKTIASYFDKDSQLQFWDLTGRKLPIHWGVRGFSDSWSPDGKFLAARGRLFDVAAGKEVRSFDGPDWDKWTGGVRWSTDSQEVSFRVESEIYTFKLQTGKLLGKRPVKPRSTVVSLHSGKCLVVSPEGHYRGTPANIDREIVYVAQINGRQETFTPEEFTKRFGWKNDPDKVRMSDGW